MTARFLRAACLLCLAFPLAARAQSVFETEDPYARYRLIYEQSKSSMGEHFDTQRKLVRNSKHLRAAEIESRLSALNRQQAILEADVDRSIRSLQMLEVGTRERQDRNVKVRQKKLLEAADEWEPPESDARSRAGRARLLDPFAAEEAEDEDQAPLDWDAALRGTCLELSEHGVARVASPCEECRTPWEVGDHPVLEMTSLIDAPAKVVAFLEACRSDKPAVAYREGGERVVRDPRAGP